MLTDRRANQFFEAPDAIGKQGFYRGVNAQGPMYATEIVMSKVYRD
jgi:hypothetical protein